MTSPRVTFNLSEHPNKINLLWSKAILSKEVSIYREGASDALGFLGSQHPKKRRKKLASSFYLAIQYKRKKWYTSIITSVEIDRYTRPHFRPNGLRQIMHHWRRQTIESQNLFFVFQYTVCAVRTYIFVKCAPWLLYMYWYLSISK